MNIFSTCPPSVCVCVCNLNAHTMFCSYNAAHTKCTKHDISCGPLKFSWKSMLRYRFTVYAYNCVQEIACQRDGGQNTFGPTTTMTSHGNECASNNNKDRYKYKSKITTYNYEYVWCYAHTFARTCIVKWWLMFFFLFTIYTRWLE